MTGDAPERRQGEGARAVVETHGRLLWQAGKGARVVFPHAAARQGSTPGEGGPDRLAAFLREERATWDPVVRAIGLVMQ